MSFYLANARWICAAFLLCFFSAFGQTFFIALSNGDIRREIGLTHGGFGLLYMGATLASAASLPFVGRVLDRFPTRPVAGGVVSLLAVACLLMSAAGSVLVLGLALYLLRLFGQGMMTQTAYTATGRWFAANRGRATAAATLGFPASEAVTPLLFVAGLGLFGWRTGWFAAGLALVFVALPLIVLLTSRERDPLSEPASETRRLAPDRTLREVIRRPSFYLVLLGVLAPPFTVTALLFHQVYLTELRGWPAGLFASSFLLLSLVSVGSILLCGWLIDRFSAVRILPFFLLPLATACLVAANVESAAAVPVFMALLGLSNGFVGTLLGALWPELYGRAHLGAIRSVVMAAVVFGSAFGPGLTGVLIDAGVSYPLQINAMALYAVLAALMFAVLAPRLAAAAERPGSVAEAEAAPAAEVAATGEPAPPR